MADPTLLVTGGSGFIGSALIRSQVDKAQRIVNVDAHTYAADDRRLPQGPSTLETLDLDITDPALFDVFDDVRPDIVVHLAAETHVTRSESDEERFFQTNVDGTRCVLEAAVRSKAGLVVHVSTDEVYGPALDHPFAEDEKEPAEGRATSAYARSKAVADDLARSYQTSIDVVVVRPANCFGPWQHPEKAIPRWTVRALTGDRLPVWGDGRYVRDWMFVDDLCSALGLLIERTPHTGVYNVGPGRDALPNVEIARRVAAAAGASSDDVYLTDYDRPQHDRVYAIDAGRIKALGWEPSVGLDNGIRATVDWYASHRDWWEPLVAGSEALYDDAQVRVER